MKRISVSSIAFLFFNDTATTEIYPLSLHDALPICQGEPGYGIKCRHGGTAAKCGTAPRFRPGSRPDTRADSAIQPKPSASSRRGVNSAILPPARLPACLL